MPSSLPDCQYADSFEKSCVGANKPKLCTKCSEWTRLQEQIEKQALSSCISEVVPSIAKTLQEILCLQASQAEEQREFNKAVLQQMYTLTQSINNRASADPNHSTILPETQPKVLSSSLTQSAQASLLEQVAEQHTTLLVEIKSTLTAQRADLRKQSSQLQNSLKQICTSLTASNDTVQSIQSTLETQSNKNAQPLLSRDASRAIESLPQNLTMHSETNSKIHESLDNINQSIQQLTAETKRIALSETTSSSQPEQSKHVNHNSYNLFKSAAFQVGESDDDDEEDDFEVLQSEPSKKHHGAVNQKFNGIEDTLTK